MWFATKRVALQQHWRRARRRPCEGVKERRQVKMAMVGSLAAPLAGHGGERGGGRGGRGGGLDESGRQ